MTTSSSAQPRKAASRSSMPSRSNASTGASSPASATSRATICALTLSATNRTSSGPNAMGPTDWISGFPTCRPYSLMTDTSGVAASHPLTRGAYAHPGVSLDGQLHVDLTRGHDRVLLVSHLHLHGDEVSPA